MKTNGLIKRILVPTDGSALANQAARYAAEIAKCFGAEITVLNAISTTVFTEFVTYAIGGTAGSKEQLWQSGTDIVEATKKTVLRAEVPVHTKIIEGPAVEVILREASEGRYDLIAMGSRGAGASLVQRAVFGLGSVAERVIASAPCPVLVIREEG